MEHTLIATIVAAFTSAWALGLATQRLGLSPIVGYLLAGILIGPHTPGFVGDIEVARQLAEIGVILMMFGVGLHFHLDDLNRVKAIAIPGALGQSIIATLLAVVVFSLFGVPAKTGAVLGMAMAVASTVVLMRVLMDANLLQSHEGYVAVGWLIVEDILTVILLVLIPVLGEKEGVAETIQTPVWQTLGIAMLKLAALVAIVLLAGSRIVPWVLMRVARLRSRELFTLTVLVVSLAIAAGSYYIFGASMALGAFLAGMVVAQSPVSHQAAADALPMRDAFAVLFFVSVGMLFDPACLGETPLLVLAALAIIIVIKPLAAILIVVAIGHTARTALTVAIGLAQIGEFSFILSELARHHGLMTAVENNILVAAAIVSITINPIFFARIPDIERLLRRSKLLWRMLNGRAESRAIQANAECSTSLERLKHDDRLAIVVGYGPVGRAVYSILSDADTATVVVDMNLDSVMMIRGEGGTAIFGDASNVSIMKEAGIEKATHLVLTMPGVSERAAIVAQSREMNPDVKIFVRAHYLREREDLTQAGATAMVFEEGEAAVGLARLVLADTGAVKEVAEAKINDIRVELLIENIQNIRSQRIRSVMVPWSEVLWLSSESDRDTIQSRIAETHYSRWPVVDPQSNSVIGYLLAKDLLYHSESLDWREIIRPMERIAPTESVGAALARMQSETASIYLVHDGKTSLGIVTWEDILEQLVGQIEDEYPHDAVLSLADAISLGGFVDVHGRTLDHVVEELSERIPQSLLPARFSTTEVARLALERESSHSTDLGNGAAIPHARCAGLRLPIVVLGRSREGIISTEESAIPINLVFLLVTPAERPEAQLTLVGQVARVLDDSERFDRLKEATSLADVLQVVRFDRPAGRPVK